MLAIARETLPEAELRVQRLEDPLPAGPIEPVFSALAVHHLDANGKRDLFGRVAAVLVPGGRFVLADVIVPASAFACIAIAANGASAVTPTARMPIAISTSSSENPRMPRIPT